MSADPKQVTRLRIKLSVSPDVSPELYKAMEAIPSRSRAERLRTLATLGLIQAQGGIIPSVTAGGPAQPTNEEHPAVDDSQEEQRRALMDQFSATLLG